MDLFDTMFDDGNGTPSAILSDLVRCHLLVSVFDSDPDEWLRFLASSATDEQRAADTPFVQWVRHEIDRDPAFIVRLEALVATSAEILFRLDRRAANNAATRSIGKKVPEGTN